MARAPSYSMEKRRNVPSPYARESRPSAFDRFPGKARNEWINEMRAKIDGTLNPPSPPGPSRSPSPLEEDEVELGVAQSGEDLELSDKGEQDELEEDEGYISGEQEDGSYENHDDHENLEDENPLGFGSQPVGQQSEDGFYEDDEEDEGIEDETEEDSLYPQLAYPTRQNLEDEDPSAHDIDPRLVNQFDAEEEFDEISEDQGPEEDDEMEGEDQEEEEDEEKENSITYIGDTDEEEVSDSEVEEEDAREEDEHTEDEDDLDDEELDDDGMGGFDTLPLESVGLENQATYEAVAPIGVEHGQVVYDYRTSNAELEYLQDTQAGLEVPAASYVDLDTGFINPSQLPVTGMAQASGSGSNLYPTLPDFTTTPGFTPASQMIPPWEPSPLDPAAIAAEKMDNALIDPSLLADFAQRVEAQVSGDLGSTTEAQNTEEMTALADAVMGQYNDTPDQILGTDSAPQLEDIEVVQFGMGEAETEGYEEDDGSRATSEDVDVQRPSEGSHLAEEATGDEDEDGSGEESGTESESRDGSSSGAVAPAVNSTRDDPIEILSSDDEVDDEQRVDNPGDEDDEEDEEDEDEEEEEVEPTRPAGIHTHFEHDMKDILTPPRSVSRSRSGLTPGTSQPESPTVRLAEILTVPDINPEEAEVVNEEEAEVTQERIEEDEGTEQDLQGGYPFSPMAVVDSELPIIEEDFPEAKSPVEPSIQAPEEVVTGTTDEIEVEQSYEPEVGEPVSRGPSVPLVTPAVELPSDTIFPNIPEAGLEAIMRVFEQPDVIEEAIEVEGDDVELEGEAQVEVTELEEDPEDIVAQETFIDVVAETASAGFSASEGQGEVEGSEATPSPLDQTPIPVSATDYATIETNTQALPDPHEAPIETDLAMPDVPYHRSRTPSLIVEPPANPPNPDIVIDAPVEEPVPESADDLPDPQDPVPDTHIAAPLSPHDMRPTLERSPSLIVNIQEVEKMLDPGPNEAREESPVDFPEHDQPAPPTDLEAPIEPEDLEPRDEPRSVSMEALAPGEAPGEEMTGATDLQEEEGILFPESGAAAPDTHIPSPLDVRRDLPLETEGSEIAPSLIVEPPSEPATGPPSLTGEDEETDLLDVPEIVLEQEEGEDEMDVPTSSNIDVPSAPLRGPTLTKEAGPSSLRATTPSNEAGSPENQHIRFASPLRHHHGHVPRHTSVPPPATRVTRRHTRQSSAAIDAISPPVTRQNCHYRKLYMAEGDMSATVLVPQCTLTDHEKLQEEHSEDRGDARPADEAEARHQPICEATPRLQTVLTAKLHRIVGSDIFDEAQKTYLLSASHAALLPNIEDGNAGASTSMPADISPVKSRRSKRLSEAPSETSIAEEPKKHKRSVSVTHTASILPEETEADMEEGYELRSKTDVPALNDEIEAEEPVQGADDTEVKTDDETVSPTSTTQAPSPKRYSLRSQTEIQAESEIASESRATTPTATEPTPTQVTPMTTRRRARESMSAAPRSSGGPSMKIEDEAEPKSPSTPRAKGKGKSKSPKKGKRDTDPKYVYSGDEDEDTDSEDEKKGEKEVKEEQTDRESSTEIIPYPSAGTPSSGTGRKKRKLGSSLGRINSPWQLGPETPDVETEETPSRRSKKRAVESKDDEDIPIPMAVGAKQEGAEAKDGVQEMPPLPQPKGWMSYIWPFKR